MSPYNPRLAYVGGVELWRAGPEQQAELAAYPYNLPGYGFGIHPDVHEIVTSEDGSMYVCTDGGVYRSDDGGLTYQPKNKGFNVTQFYALAFGPNGEVLVEHKTMGLCCLEKMPMWECNCTVATVSIAG